TLRLVEVVTTPALPAAGTLPVAPQAATALEVRLRGGASMLVSDTYPSNLAPWGGRSPSEP
ncbi:MAG: hypothetical protein NTV80_11325, partial [Verrucomicrobia bacterium]|nr:hypothetical protein [Verrucomicrobiota bacterium]